LAEKLNFVHRREGSEIAVLAGSRGLEFDVSRLTRRPISG
jgi:hypothetical protein